MTGGWSEAQARDGRVQAELDVWADADSHQPTGRRHHLDRKAQAEYLYIPRKPRTQALTITTLLTMLGSICCGVEGTESQQQ